MPSEEPNLQIDVNKIIAYTAIESLKESIAAITRKRKVEREKGVSLTQVDGTIEIGKLKPWKQLEESVLVVLGCYPALVDLLQNDDLRNELLLYDTGGGLLFAKPGIRSYLPTARVSRISGINKDVESAVNVLERGFLLGAYSTSIKSLFDRVRPALDPDFRDLVELNFYYLSERIRKENINEFLDLHIPVLEYDSRLRNIFKEIAFVCESSVGLAMRFVRKLDADHLEEHGGEILRTTSATTSSIATLRVLGNQYNLDESNRYDEASSKLKEIENLVSSAEKYNASS